MSSGLDPSILTFSHSMQVGIHECLSTSIMKCDLDIRRQLYGNIILSGGSTMFDGMGDRLLKEVTS